MTEATTNKPGVYRFIGMDWDLGALKNSGSQYRYWIALLAIFIVVGVAAWFLLVTRGGEVLNMRDSSPWGLWFVNYMYYIGLSAGGLAVYASVHLFGAKQYAPLSRLAVLQAGVLVMLALLGIITDMERPWRAINMLLSPNPTSPFIFTGSAAATYMVLCFVDLWVLITGKGGHKLAHNMTLIALPTAVYLHTTTAFVLSMMKPRELWHTAVMVPIFLTSATASGIALLMLFAYVLQKFADFKFKSSMFRSLSTLLATVIIIDLFLLGVELLSIFWATSAKPGHTIRMAEFLGGRYAFALWPLFIMGIAAFAMLAKRSTRHLPAIQITAAIMYVVAIFFKRYALLSMGFSYSVLGQPNPIYFPSIVETFLALGLLALGLLIVSLAVKVIQLEVPEGEHDEHGHEPSVIEAKTAVGEQPSFDGGVAS